MSYVVTFEDFTPVPRFDGVAWEFVRIEESAAEEDSPWTAIDTISFTPDVDPENPASRNFTTPNGTALDQWYRLIFIDGAANESEPTVPLQNTQAVPLIAEEPYATVNELAEILRVDEVTRATALERVLGAAAAEINAELGRASPYEAGEVPALVVEVNLERAVEHWKQMESPFGVIGLGGIETPAFTSVDTWNRHAAKLAPLKESWGIA